MSARRVAGDGGTARTAYLFLAPGLLLFVVFRVYPLLEGLRLSFTNARLGRAT